MIWELRLKTIDTFSMKNLVLGFFCCFIWMQGVVLGQETIRGKVVDAKSGQPIAFANVLVNKARHQGVVAGLDGQFRASISSKNDSLFVSCLGYFPFRGVWSQLGQKDSVWVISLREKQTAISAVEIEAYRDPGFAIMKRVINNLEFNDPERLPSFAYRSYSKFLFDFLPVGSDTTGWSQSDKELFEIADSLGIMVLESVTERKFLAPSHTEEKVVAARISGFQQPQFALLATDLQPFSFYRPLITLLEQDYVSPLNKRFWTRYHFSCLDTLIRENDSIFYLQFGPKGGLTFPSLTGTLHVTSNGYALVDIQAAPDAEGPMNITVRQDYHRPDSVHWFPFSLRVNLESMAFSPKNGLRLSGESFFKDVAVGTPLRKRDFGIDEVFMDKGAAVNRDSYWDSVRVSPLTVKEIATYQLLDSMGSDGSLDKLVNWTESISGGYFNLGQVEVNLNRLATFNGYEATRLGLSLRPHALMFGFLQPEAYFAYGIRDKTWKYGGDLRVVFDRQADWQWKIYASQDLEEPGRAWSIYQAPTQQVRDLVGYRMDSVRKAGSWVSGRLFKYLTFKAGAEWADHNPTYDYQWNGHESSHYTWVEGLLRWRLAWGEKYSHMFNLRTVSSRPWPVVEGEVSRGWGLVPDNFSFTRLSVQVSHRWATGTGGNSQLMVVGEKLWGDAPLARLFFINGTRGVDNRWLFGPGSFQTLGPYRYVADQYVALFYRHLFGIYFFENKHSRPQPEFLQSFAIGSLRNPERHQGDRLLMQAPIKGIAETGLMINGLLRYEISSVGYIGLFIGSFWQWYPAPLDDWRGSVIFKAGLRFTTR